jgi:hypothetical protein
MAQLQKSPLRAGFFVCFESPGLNPATGQWSQRKSTDSSLIWAYNICEFSAAFGDKKYGQVQPADAFIDL